MIYHYDKSFGHGVLLWFATAVPAVRTRIGEPEIVSKSVGAVPAIETFVRYPLMARVVATQAKLSVTVCGFEFSFHDRDEAAVYLRWFEDYAKQHRRQFDIINAKPSLRNQLVKLPAKLFKTQNRAKVIKALKAAVDGGCPCVSLHSQSPRLRRGTRQRSSP